MIFKEFKEAKDFKELNSKLIIYPNLLSFVTCPSSFPKSVVPCLSSFVLKSGIRNRSRIGTVVDRVPAVGSAQNFVGSIAFSRVEHMAESTFRRIGARS